MQGQITTNGCNNILNRTKLYLNQHEHFHVVGPILLDQCCILRNCSLRENSLDIFQITGLEFKKIKVGIKKPRTKNIKIEQASRNTLLHSVIYYKPLWPLGIAPEGKRRRITAESKTSLWFGLTGGWIQHVSCFHHIFFHFYL